jgi:amino acid transporter
VVTPASSVFIIVPVAFASLGTATFLSFVVAALVGVAMALCWAELGAAYPLAGGDYAIVARAIGPAWGFAAFCLMLGVVACAIPVLALGMGSYLKVLVDVDPRIAAIMGILVSALIAIFNVRFGAVVTGLFLAIEIVVLAVVAYLGFAHIERPFMELLQPAALNPNGQRVSAPFGLIMSGVAMAIFSYDGYRATIYLSEEMKGVFGRGIAKATLWSLAITVCAELIPVTAVLLGAKSIPDLGKAPDLTAFVIERGGRALNTFVSLAVAGAILNALIAIFIFSSRLLYSSGRDKAWPEPIGRWLASVHGMHRTPWLAVILLGFLVAIITPLTDINSLANVIGALLTAIYLLIAIAAIVNRIRHSDRSRPYRMPLWPVAPVLALAVLAYVMTQQATNDLWIAAGFVLIALAYHRFCLASGAGERWVMKEAPASSKQINL